MNKPKVSLLGYTQGLMKFVLSSPEQLLSVGKRICNTDETLMDIAINNTDKMAKRRNLQTIKDGHMGVLEHIQFIFLIEGVSRVMTHQLVRHRMASYLQMSQRVVPMSKLHFFIPPSIQGTEWEHVWLEELEKLKEIYDKMDTERLPDGKRRFDRGDIRYIMPHGMETRVWMTINGRSLCHFLKERLINSHAQWEIKEVARQMYEHAHNVCPDLIDIERSETWE